MIGINEALAKGNNMPSHGVRVRKSKNKKMNPVVFYCLIFAGAICAGILAYEIFLLFRQAHALGTSDSPVQINTPGVNSD